MGAETTSIPGPRRRGFSRLPPAAHWPWPLVASAATVLAAFMDRLRHGGRPPPALRRQGPPARGPARPRQPDAGMDAARRGLAAPPHLLNVLPAQSDYPVPLGALRQPPGRRVLRRRHGRPGPRGGAGHRRPVGGRGGDGGAGPEPRLAVPAGHADDGAPVPRPRVAGWRCSSCAGASTGRAGTSSRRRCLGLACLVRYEAWPVAAAGRGGSRCGRRPDLAVAPECGRRSCSASASWGPCCSSASTRGSPPSGPST